MKIGIQTKIQTKEVQAKEELYIPVDRGRLVTSFSTGMTIDDINDEIISTRLSASEVKQNGGKAKPKSKVKAKIDKIRKKKKEKRTRWKKCALNCSTIHVVEQ